MIKDSLTFEYIEKILDKIVPSPKRVFFAPMDMMGNLVEQFWKDNRFTINRTTIKIGGMKIFFSHLLDGTDIYEIDSKFDPEVPLAWVHKPVFPGKL